MIESVVDILVSNGTVLTMNAAGDIIPNAAVAIKGDRIAAVGPMKDFAVCRASRTIDAQGGIILPGLVNTHTHAAMTCFRGLADDLPLIHGSMITFFRPKPDSRPKWFMPERCWPARK